MPINLSIDPALLERAVQISGERTSDAAIARALQEFIARHERLRIIELFGKFEWDQRCDYKAERSRLN